MDNKNFPIVFFSEGDLNFTDLKNGKNPVFIFKQDNLVSQRVSQLAKDLNVQNVAECFTRLSVIGVSMFGLNGNIRLESYLFIYNRNGRLLLDAVGWTKPTVVLGKKVEDYQQQLEQFGDMTILISKELKKHIRQ